MEEANLIDDDVLLDSQQGLFCAFNDNGDEDFDPNLYNEMENDEQRKQYIEDSFSDTDSVTKWKHIKATAVRVELNGAENRLLEGMKASIAPVMTTCERIVGKQAQDMLQADFVSIYLNRDWYLLMEEYINARVTEPNMNRATINEIHEMMRVWILQCCYQVTAKTLYTNTTWYAPIRKIDLTYDRFAFLFKKLGADLPPISILLGQNDAHEDEKATEVWGSFNQYNDIVCKLERHVGEIGKGFILENITDITIDDDKLRHQSSTFRDHGLQLTGFRGSRCGPVMNCSGTVQTSLILSIYFGRMGDAALSVVKNLMRYLGYGEESHLRQRLDVVVLLDRGYHVSSVIKFFLGLRASLLGTHSEKAGDWCFCSGGDARPHQKTVPIEGARAVFSASRKVKNVVTYATCYCNGNKGIGNLHSTLPFSGVWDLVCKNRSLTSLPPAPTFPAMTVETAYNRWLGDVIVFVACQGCSPWFEARVGHLTGTTCLKLMKTLKFVMLDSEIMTKMDPNLRYLLEGVIGLSLARKTKEQVARTSPTALKKAYKSLGYKAAAATTTETMVEVVAKQHPSDALVFQRIVQAWCMTPIKRKNKEVVEAFQQGRLAEPLIHANVASFINRHSKGLITIRQAFDVGLLKHRSNPILAVSPDAVAVLHVVGTLSDDISVESQLGQDHCKLIAFIFSEIFVIDSYDPMEYPYHEIMCCMEYKHKSETATIQETRNILSTHLKGNRVRVLLLGDADDDELFKKAIPNVDYRCQVLHEVVVSVVGIAIYAVATTAVEFVLVLLCPSYVEDAYMAMAKYIKRYHMKWLFLD